MNTDTSSKDRAGYCSVVTCRSTTPTTPRSRKRAAASKPKPTVSQARLSLEQGLKLTDTDRQDILAVTEDVGDDRLNERANGDPDEVGDHGRSQNRRLWAERGLNSGGSLGQCNTFNAPASEVE